MKTFLSLFLFLGVMVQSFTGFAQTPITIGTGTTAANANALFSTSTTTNKYARTISIYTPAEIAAAGGTAGIISKLAWYKDGTGEYTSNDMTLAIYMKHVPYTIHPTDPVDWNTEVAGATQVYSTTTGSFPTGTGWKEFVFSTPFNYNGSGNLEILVDFYRVSAPTASITWQYSTLVDGVSATQVGSSALPTVRLTEKRPNVQLTITPAGPCTAPPTPGTASASTTTVCPNTNFTLTLAGSSFGAGQTFQWESAPTNAGPWTGIGTPSMSTVLTTSQTTTTYYRMAVTCSGQTAYSNTLQINTSAIPVSGTFTINKTLPASATNFVSFTSALASLECGGVNGPVTFNVAANSGPYTEQVLITAIPGTSATNKVTFNGNNNVVSFAGTAANRPVFRLDGAKFVTLNGLNIQATDATNGWGIHFLNGADNNTVSGNTITLASTSTTEANSVGIVFSNSATAVTTAGNTGNNNVISGNTITGGYKGIHLNSVVTTASNNQIINNTISDFYASGIEINAANGTLVEGNNISRPTRTTTTTFYGIEVNGNSQATTISKNRIHNSHTATTIVTGTAYGISISAADAPAGSENIVKNNLIHDLSTTGSIYALYNSNSDGAHYFHNTVSLDNVMNTGTNRGFYQTGAATNIRFENNVVSISAVGGAARHGIYLGTATSVVASDGNVLHVINGTASAGIGYKGSNQATLADWQTASGQDLNSVAVAPAFSSPATGDFTPTNVTVNNKGRAGTGVTHDILGTTRNPNAPDPGAYEFLNLTTDVGITAITSPNSDCGLSAAETITVVVTNFGTSAQSNIPVTYSINGNTQVTATVAGPLAPGTNFTFSFPTTADLSAQGGYTIVASANLTGDLDLTNNSTTKVVTNSRFASLPQLNFETAATGIASMRLLTNARSSVYESPAAGFGTGSSKGLILDATAPAGWTMPVGLIDPWNSNPEHLAAAYICFDPQGAANPTTPLWLSFDLKQLFKTANANTNFRITVNGTQVGPTYRPPFAGTPINWQKIYVDLTPYKNLPGIELGFESSTAESFANGTANLIDNIQIVRLNPTGTKETLQAASLSVYPNPSNGAFTVSLPQSNSFELEVTDLTGKVISHQQVSASQTNVDISKMAKGVYLLKVTTAHGAAVKRVVVE